MHDLSARVTSKKRSWGAFRHVSVIKPIEIRTSHRDFLVSTKQPYLVQFKFAVAAL